MENRLDQFETVPRQESAQRARFRLVHHDHVRQGRRARAVARGGLARETDRAPAGILVVEERHLCAREAETIVHARRVRRRAVPRPFGVVWTSVVRAGTTRGDDRRVRLVRRLCVVLVDETCRIARKLR